MIFAALRKLGTADLVGLWETQRIELKMARQVNAEVEAPFLSSSTPKDDTSPKKGVR